MAESTERIVFDIFARDRGASRTFEGVGRSADDAGDSIDHLGRDSRVLDKRIEETRTHLRGLIAEFEKTGDAKLFKDVRKDRSVLSLLESMRKEADTVGKHVGVAADDALKAGKKAGNAFTSGFNDAIGALPSELRGMIIIGLAGLVAANLPTIGSMIGGAVLGGVGVGGIIGGIALAAQDPAVAASAKEVGRSFFQSLKNEASQSFAGPLLAALSPLERAGNSLAETLGKGFKDLAPAVVPLAHGIEGLVREMGPGLSKAFKAAEPAVQALARELPNVGRAIGDALSDIADGADGAIMGLVALLRVTEGFIRAGGQTIKVLSNIFEFLVKTEGAALDFLSTMPMVGLLGPAFRLGAKGADDLQRSVNDAKATGSSFVGTISDLVRGLQDNRDAATKARDAMVEWAKVLQDSIDPTFNFIHRLEDVRKAREDYTRAVSEHGRKSPEAREAELRLAEAILAANSAAATASGTFNGHFTDAMKNTLRAGGMTEAQIRDIEKAARDAQAALHNFEGVYTATARLKVNISGLTSIHFDAEGNPVGHRAMGGPVLPGRSYVVGENGPEVLHMGSASGFVSSNAASRAMLSGASGGAAAPTQIEVIGRFEGTGMERDLGEALMRFMRYQVRTVGGGSVQTTYGG